MTQMQQPAIPFLLQRQLTTGSVCDCHSNPEKADSSKRKPSISHAQTGSPAGEHAKPEHCPSDRQHPHHVDSLTARVFTTRTLRRRRCQTGHQVLQYANK